VRAAPSRPYDRVVDLQIILRVLWRFRLILAIGVILAAVMALLSFFKVDSSGKLAPRQAEQWESLSTLFITSHGFPWGSIGTPSSPAPSGGTRATATPDPSSSLDPAHLTGLAALYIRLATSDPVLNLVTREALTDGTLQAFPVSSDDSGRGSVLPMLTLSAVAPTPERARQLAARHIRAFVRYIETEQRRAGIPGAQRVVVDVVRRPQQPTLLVGRKTTRPIVVFVAIMTAVIGLAFALENIRPRVRLLPAESAGAEPPPAEPVVGRRSA
jgi:hypothetical protein